MLVELVEIKKKTDTQYALEKIYLNPKHIVYISEDRSMKSIVKEGKANLGLVDGATFSKIRINHNDSLNEITVIGDPAVIENKIFKNSKRQILRG
tara:strand:- start:228 stop:512 length:285 start_codon:yes stop_codon:yes gene_type:complete